MASHDVAIEASSAGSGSNTDSCTDADSLYDSEDGSITDTLKSNWMKERNQWIDKHRYHTFEEGGVHIIPNDPAQQEVVDMMHSVYGLILEHWKKDTIKPPYLHCAPIGDKPQRILDAGTGTGIWAIDAGDAYPSAKVVGCDLSAIQPTWVPPNVTFEINDLSKEWTYSKDSFDLVYARAVHTEISDWPHMCREAFKAIKPGGYMEVFSEIPYTLSDDDTIPKDWPFTKWLKYMDDGLKKANNTMYIDKTIEPDMQAAGFQDIKLEKLKVPLGPWPKDPMLKKIGAYFLAYILEGLEGWSLVVFTQLLGWTMDDTKKFVGEVRKTLRDKKVHVYLDFLIATGKKPEN